MNPFENMMKQFQNMQQSMSQLDQELAKIHLQGESGAGLVKLTVNGNGDALALEIDDSIYQEEKQVLNGLVVAAINDANRKCQQAKKDKMQSMLKGLGLPSDFNFPFAT